MQNLNQTMKHIFFVDDELEFAVEVSSNVSLTARVRIVAYGAAQLDEQCVTATCGDFTREEEVSVDSRKSIKIYVQLKYARAGKYLVRTFVSDKTGSFDQKDFTFIVRKLGDTEAAAPCCRSTGLIVAGQKGRPSHPKVFQHSQVVKLSRDLGWDLEYIHKDDLEAERLFDYTLLAPYKAGAVYAQIIFLFFKIKLYTIIYIAVYVHVFATFFILSVVCEEYTLFKCQQ
eukprot:TRINITY_DN116_c1_g1_i2.p1 TRINITY_DN116_c1_g1~~TRINITY_DN116_c1_g1_i2.p1  ORF type:complete len:238 (-),score=29.82 TRINITY_DN116_c1_g1_i2:114-800(-)